MQNLTCLRVLQAGVCLLLGLTLYAQPVQKAHKAGKAVAGATAFNGTVAGNFSVNANGAVNYVIQPFIPPGTNGFQPSLQLAYSSQGSNGLLGMGFSLNGLSAISRAGATVPQDGSRGGVNYNSGDRFSLDGNRLMAENTGGSSAYFTPGTVYYTEQQGWSKVVANGSSGSGPASFTAYLKDGAVAQYGNGNGSQVLAQGSSFSGGSLQGSVRKWLISSVTDDNGNTISYFYTPSPKNMQGLSITGCTADGTAYPDAIYYTSNGTAPANRKIQFLYEPRADTLLQYAGGANFRISVRLKAIQSFIINGADTTSVNTCQLTYDAAAPLQVSRITSIVNLGSQGGSTVPLTLQWTNGANSLAGSSVSWAGPLANAGFEGDFNGDGKTDLLPVTNNTIGSIYYAGSAGFTQQALSPTILVTPTTYVADYNGDGLPDVLVLKPGGTGKLYLCNGQGFNDAANLSGLKFNNDGTNTWVADFNGDGMADLFSTAGTAGYMYLATGNGFGSVQTISGLSLQSGQTFVADFNGDGQADVFSGSTAGGNLYLSNFSQNNSFQPAITVGGMTLSNTPENNLVSDFNSDGLADILTHTANQYNLYYATGQGFASAVPISNINLNITQNWLSDFNGDGMMDLYALAGSTATIYYYYGTQFQPQTTSSPAFIKEDTWSGDFNGDGIADLFATNTKTIYYGSNAAKAALPAVNQVPNLVTSINNGINSVTTINYKPITDAAVYQPGTSAAHLMDGIYTQNKYNNIALAPSQLNPYPFVHNQSALYVVQQYAVSDGLGNTYPYWYKYMGSLQDIQAYGWLGFKQVIETDSSGQNIFTSNYLQPFPLTGRLSSRVTANLSGNWLTQQRNYYQLITNTLPPLQSHTYQAVTTATRADHYDYGMFAYTTGANYGYDGYGNNTTVAQLNDTAENKVLYTLYQYINDTASWHIGFITSSKLSSDSLGGNLLSNTTYQYNADTYQLTTQGYWLNTSNTWLYKNYGYDVYGNTIFKVDEAGDTTTYTYDAVFHTFPSTQTSPPNQWNNKLVNTMVYNPAFGKLQTATDANGNTTQVLSDQFGRDSLITGPDSTGQPVVLSQLFYYADSTGYTQQQVARNDWAGARWDTSEVIYDGLSRDYLHTWRGQYHQLVYQRQAFNSNNQTTWLGLPYFDGQQQQGTAFVFDPYQRIISVTVPGPNNQPVINQYSYTGKQVMVHNAVGTADSTTSHHSFDYFNGGRKTVQRIDESGLTTAFAYGLLASDSVITDPAGLTSSFTYNSLGDVITTNNPSSGTQTTQYNYTANNQVTTDNMGNAVTTQYDALGRKLAITSPAGASYFQYDVTGVKNGLANLCTVLMPDTGTYYSYQYNAYQQQTTATLHIAGHSYTQGFAFNADKTNSAITYPDNSVAHYTYYDNGGLQQVSMADALGANTSTPYITYNLYDAAGNQQLITYGNGVQRTAAFNPFGMLNNYKISVADGQPIASKYYAWNSVNNITGIIDSLSGASSQYFGYQSNGRLLNATGAYGQSTYGYDAAGNITSNGAVTLQYSNYQATAAFKNGAKILSNVYNANGNLVQRTAWQGQDSTQTQYHFNALNQLTSIVSGGKAQLSFLYDAAGQRLVKKDLNTGITTYYISPQYQVAVTADSFFITKYVCAPGNFIASVTHGKSLIGGGASAGVTTYLHQDFVNSTNYTTNTSGNTASQVTYQPFGQPFSITGADTAQYLFGSKQLDESGLYYFNSRYYDPVTARFITADDVPGGSVTQTDAFNRYAYTLNNPVKYADPTGHTIGLDILMGLQFLADIFSDGATVAEQVVVDEALAARAANEVGEGFLKALGESRVTGTIDDTRAIQIYKTVRGYANLEFAGDEGVTDVGPFQSVDNYGNTLYKNQDPKNIGVEKEWMQYEIDNEGTQHLYSKRAVGNLLNENRGSFYKYVVSAEDYSIRISDGSMVAHPAVEGEGGRVYTGGWVKLDQQGTLTVDYHSGHYRPEGYSVQMSDPLWRMMKNKGYLNFNKIIYTRSLLGFGPED